MSSKIKLVTFKKDSTIIGDVVSYQPRDANSPYNEKTPAKEYDIPRHADFERAGDKMKAHLPILLGFAEPFDAIGNKLTKNDFNEFFADTKEAPMAFQGLEFVGVIIHGKNAADGIQLVGTKTTERGGVIKLKTDPIPLKRVEGAVNYPLIEILDEQFDHFMAEAEKYKDRKKHGAGVQIEAALHVQPQPNTENKIKKVHSSQNNLVEA